MMRTAALVLAGCGRIAFDATSDAGTGDGPRDGAGADVMMIDPAGTLDPGFGGTGMIQPSSAGESIAFDIIPRGTGYLVVGVDYTAVGGAQMNVIALKDGGALDPSWAGTGEMIVKAMSATTSFGYGIHVLPSNDLLFVGDADTTGTDDFVVSRFSQGGAFDPSFGGVDGFVTYNINPPGTGGDTGRAAVTVNGITYICGNADYSGDMRFAVIAIDPADGSLEPTFQTAGVLSGQYTAQQDECSDITTDGTFLYGAGRTGGANVVLFRLALTGTGTPISSSLGSGHALAVKRMPDGKFYVAGYDGPDGFIVRLQDFTTLDTSFAGTGRVQVIGDTFEGLAVDAQGRIVVAGRRGNQFPVIRRFLSNGMPDPSFGMNGAVALTSVPAGDLHAVMIDSIGRIVAVGGIDDGLNHMLVLRLN